jgi:hypothetical protein
LGLSHLFFVQFVLRAVRTGTKTDTLSRTLTTRQRLHPKAAAKSNLR